MITEWNKGWFPVRSRSYTYDLYNMLKLTTSFISELDMVLNNDR